jgi:hypothetical protein
MNAIVTEDDLAQAVLTIEKKQKEQGIIVVAEFNELLQSVRPSAILKNILTEITSSGELKDNLVNTSAGVAAGIVAKRLVAGKNAGIVRQVVSNGIQFGVTNIIARNPETIKTIGTTLFLFAKQLLKKRTNTRII